MASASTSSVIVLPDAGPLITLAYADALDLLFKPGWQVGIVDMVLHEVTRNTTPTSEKIRGWASASELDITTTRTYQLHQRLLDEGKVKPRKTNLGELAIQEAMNELALVKPDTTGVFLFEDHKIARTSFLIPDNCRKISTRAWLQFLEGKGWIASAVDIERQAIINGRNFSQLRFPP